ncbi:DNA polymerase III subunit theta [Yersinia rohdei]|uniref:DNA polymerase III subunit theta n=1 Tax=Yersinia rohdei TaxID=29485 RepID=UPI0021BD9780|nr:DNA polymerase III subunit theta [Yersinia rohdei]
MKSTKSFICSVQVTGWDASGVAFKERYNMPVIPEMVARAQPEALREYFLQRLAHYRNESNKFSRLPYEPKMK